jgi:threonylcarbamoyladenosine tRNA methylthiotransferase MtaB
VPRLRLSSLEPWDLDKGFFSLWREARLCRHLHLPLQSGSTTVLRRMRRKTTPASFAALVEEARRIIPEVAITTDLITGFPGETGEEFHETMNFVRSTQFAGGHVFTYSPRPGTPAVRMKDQVGHATAKERSIALRGLLVESARVYCETFIGRNASVLWESTDQLGSHGWKMEGLTDTYLRVSANSPNPRWNELDDVLLTGVNDQGGLNGVIQTG